MNTFSDHLRIVVADDERDMRQFLQEVLTHIGHNVLAVAETGRQLIDACHATPPDLVITDIRMPDMDGLEAAEAIVKDRPVPVIVVSAHDDAELLERARAGPIMNYLIKPVKPADLQAVIAMTMVRFAQLREANAEAAQLRHALEERKLIERAKGIVSKRLRVEEPDAYRKLQKMASVYNRKLADVAQQVVNSDKVFQELENNNSR